MPVQRALLPRTTLFAALALTTPTLAAGPWHAAPVANLRGTDVATGAALGANGTGYAVTWDSSNLTTILEATHTTTAGPSFGVRSQETGATARPLLSYNGARVVVAWSPSGDVRRGSFGSALTSGASNAFGLPVRALAVDAAGSDLAIAGLWAGIPFLPNSSRSADAFGSDRTDTVIASDTTDITGVALRGTAGVALAHAVGVSSVHVTPNVVSQGFAEVAGAPAELATNPVIASNADGAFLAMGVNGVGVLLPSIVGALQPCGVTTSDATAMASVGSIFWVGRSDGTVEVIDPATDCNTLPSAVHVTGLARVDALAVADEALVLALGPAVDDTVAAWRNRPPLAPGLTGGGDVDDDSTETITATANDPDVTAGGDDPQTFAWSCDPALSATGTDTATVTVTTPSLCVDAAEPTRRTDLKCTVTTTDSDGEVSPSNEASFSVLPVDGELPTVSGVVGLTDDDIVPTGTDLSLLAEADDACPYQATWTVRHEESGSVISSQTLAWDTPFAFTAVTQGADQLTWYALELTVTDTAGNPGALGPFRFGVGLPQPPLDVSLSCPASVEAGAAGTAGAVPAATSGLVLDYAWEVSGAASIADATPTDDTLTFQTDACEGGGEAVVRMQPHGLFEDGGWQSCTVALLEPLDPAPPALAFAEGPALDVALGARPVEVLVHPVVTACASHDVVVRWDVSALPEALRPAGVDVNGTLTLSRAAALRMVIGPSLFSALHGMVVPVRATAIDERTALTSDAVEVLVRFGADAALTATAGLDVRLAVDAVGPVADGDLVTITGTIATDAAVALPGLSLVLAGDGLVPVPGSVVTASACGARADVVHQGADAQVTLEGVSAACSIDVRLLVRRGFGAGGLTVRDCAWGGERTPLARCTGALSPTAPPALSCAGTGGAPLVVVLLAALGARRRR